MRTALTFRRAGCQLLTLALMLMFVGTRHQVSAQSAAWQTRTTDHFEIYYQPLAADRVDRVVMEAERAYGHISGDFRYDLAERVPLILVASNRELPVREQTATAIVRASGAPNRHHLLLPVEPADGRDGLVTHELTHQFEFEMLPSSARLPPWVSEGLPEYERGRWTSSGSPVLRGAAVVPSVSQLTSSDRSWGRVVFDFIADEYGTEGIRRYLSALKEDATNGLALQRAFGLTSEQFDRAFERYVKAR